MSDPQDEQITPVTPAHLAKIAGQGVYASPTSIDPAAAAVSEALVATLNGSAEQSVLTGELRELVDKVKAAATIGFPRITADDGVRLSAHTIKLKGDQPRPVVIVPAGWTPLGWTLFEYTYLRLALRGYHVLAYTPRGIGLTFPIPGGGFIDAPFTSGGTVDVAGPSDWADGSTVIDYAQQHFNPSRIAFLGESYGSGIGQLVAAHDPAARVDAVVALSTWGDLADSLLQNDTRHTAAVDALVAFTGGPAERKFDPATRQILADFAAGQNLDEVIAWGRERSPRSYVEQTNARGVPTFISNTWHETLFPINQLVGHFEALTVPKHLNLWIGDHAAPEGAGLTIPSSGPSEPVDEALAWLDHHILGTPNEVPQWSPVAGQIMFTYTTSTDPGTGKPVITEPARRETSASWSEITTSTERWYLTAAASGGRDGGLALAEQTGWKREFTVERPTEAVAVDAIITTGQAEWKGDPKIYPTDKFDRRHLAVWAGEPLDAPRAGGAARRIRGIPELTLAVRSTVETTTLVAYLFDAAPDGTARVITHEPVTLTDLTPGQDRNVSWRLQAAGHDVPAGHRLLLVITGNDPLYRDASVDGSVTTIGSTAIAAARLDLPLG
ncbi:alpha/beta fold hydrolase (plasmid) [Streptomyces sp. BI20]|uniref:alpha/beta fold hydrolase n=1 Tax=Streptomyces sp. BI20 TaxID=3403460 RepID=UPI003C77F3FA